MESNRETDPVTITLLQHTGRMGTFALRASGDWLQEIGHDPEIIGKTLAQTALRHQLSGLVATADAPYVPALTSELAGGKETTAVPLYTLDSKGIHPTALTNLNLLENMVRAITSRRPELGSRVGIITIPQPPQGATYSLQPQATTEGFIVNGYEIKNTGIIPEPRLVLPLHTSIASGRVLR